MEDINQLNEAFYSFTMASKSLEAYYGKLQEEVRYLTLELEEKNKLLKDALNDAQEVKDYLNGVLQSMKEAIVVLDTDKNVTMMNRAAEELLGLSKEYAIGRAIESFDFSINREGTETELLAGGKKFSIILSDSEVLDQGGLIRGHVILLQDITRIKYLEAENERNHRLIAMGEMAAKIVHEIRSPLCSIELYSSMLAKDLEGTKHVELANGISTGIKSLNNILTNMLFFAKPQKPAFVSVDISKIISESLFMTAPLVDSRGLHLDISEVSSVRASGDAELIKQVFLNILINAIHASPDGGNIRIETRDEGGSAVVEITDDGDGIKEENLERIFDPFFSTKDKGTGLGLTIASRIMQAHAGSIRVRRSESGGSCFGLYFPCSRAEAAENKNLRKGIAS